MGMALLRRMKKGGKEGSPSAMGHELPHEALMPMLPSPPEPSVSHRHAAGPVVHIHIGPNAQGPADDPESPQENFGESPAAEAAELPPPILLRHLHDKLQAARAAKRK